MPYIKTTWIDEVPTSSPVKYKISHATDGDITTDAKIEVVTSVTPGTPVNSVNLNKIETGIETAQATAEVAQIDATSALARKLVAKRQGGNVTDWNVSGITNYTPNLPSLQVGISSDVAVSTLISGYYQGSVSITFPTAYTNIPLVIVSINNNNTSSAIAIAEISALSKTAVTIRIKSNAAISANAAWIAIGE